MYSVTSDPINPCKIVKYTRIWEFLWNLVKNLNFKCDGKYILEHLAANFALICENCRKFAMFSPCFCWQKVDTNSIPVIKFCFLHEITQITCNISEKHERWKILTSCVVTLVVATPQHFLNKKKSTKS